jgi:N-acetylneuraminic acid mutarotase
VRRALFGVGALVGIAVVSGSCGAGRDSHSSTPGTTVTTTTTSRPSAVLRVTATGWALPAPVAREVVVTSGRELIVLGGLDATKFSTAAVVRVDTTTGASQSGGTLAEAVHDAAGVRLGDAILVFGGGGPSENGTSDVQSVPTNGATTVLGKLPQPRSDHVAVAIAGKAYVLGGYDGHNIVADVVSTDDGKSFTNVAVLPVPVRYPAVAVVGKMIYLFGGVKDSQAGVDTSAVQRVDTTSGKIDVVAQLPTSLSHASAMVLDGQVFVAGGYINNTQLSDQILRFDPRSATTAIAGHLPAPISDAASAVIANRGLLVGGQGTDRAPVASVTAISAN